MSDINVFRTTLFRFSKVLISFIVIIAFFSIYNIFLIDQNLESLKLTLEQSDLAYETSDTDGLDIILTQAIAEEIMPDELDSLNIINLAYARSIIDTGKNYQQIGHLKVALNTVIDKKEGNRGVLFNLLDKANRLFRKGITFLVRLPYRIFRPRKPTKAAEVDMQLFDAAKTLEKNGKLKEAVTYYNDFISKYPGYEKIALVKLRLAYTHYKLGEYKKTFSICQEITKMHFEEKESDIANVLLLQLKQREKLVEEKNRLLIKSVEIPEDDKAARQDVLYQLGTINLRLLDLEAAKKFFKRAIKVDPTSDKATKCQFIYAWITKEQAEAEMSLSEFSKLVDKKPSETLTILSRYQMADIYHRRGKYKQAVEIYEKLAEDYEDRPVASFCLFQAAASYMYDLNDDEKAKELFGKLSKKYPKSPYSKFLAPDSAIGLFITYLVPRATRVVAWRVGGLLCLTGLSGELVKFNTTAKERNFNSAFNDWLRSELPDTVGNMYVDIRGSEVDFKDGTAEGSGNITMGRYEVKGLAEGYLNLSEDGSVEPVLTKAFLEKIPIPPVLINNAIRGIFLIVKKYFPVFITKVSITEDEFFCEGIGSRMLIERFEKSAQRRSHMIELEIEDIENIQEQQDLYALFKERLPESRFSPNPVYNIDDLFYDFFTRMYFYMGFKLLETVKDSKIDYQRSIRTLGRLMVKRERFGVTYTENDINASLNRLVRNDFPWLINNQFLFDIKGLEIDFDDSGDIAFESALRLGYGKLPMNPTNVTARGKFVFDIDKESKIPKVVFKEITLDNKPFPTEQLNVVTERVLELLQDNHLPFQLDEIKINSEEIMLKGIGARDFTNRVFSDPHLFVIFQIRHWDLDIAGIERLKVRPGTMGDYWRGEAAGGWTPGKLGTELIKKGAGYKK